ncbi:hypothetical protein [Enterococcus gallinarum]|uniref:hypothetical protein n=1 Tax=Enterococcus gallinarum TaxID=1353 RepID=UPI001CAA6298|nr:hypothetical protein [Enterococcus gallinarum]
MKEWIKENNDKILEVALFITLFATGLMAGLGLAYENVAKNAVHVDIVQQNNLTQGTVTYPKNSNVKIETRNGQTIIVVK